MGFGGIIAGSGQFLHWLVMLDINPLPPSGVQLPRSAQITQYIE